MSAEQPSTAATCAVRFIAISPEPVWLPGSYRITSIAVDCNRAGIRGRRPMQRSLRVLAIGLLALSFATLLQAQRAPMTFFVTSSGLGKGGNLGGIKGADAHCQALAQSAGAGAKTWRAYLSVTDLNGKGAI